MDGISRSMFDSWLIDGYLPLVPGLVAQLHSGVRVADVACGTGHALVLLARAFPASTFVGFDLDDGAIARARAEARGAQLTNVTFEVCDAAALDRRPIPSTRCSCSTRCTTRSTRSRCSTAISSRVASRVRCS